jgi:hypothetical protein
MVFINSPILSINLKLQFYLSKPLVVP